MIDTYPHRETCVLKSFDCDSLTVELLHWYPFHQSVAVRSSFRTSVAVAAAIAASGILVAAATAVGADAAEKKSAAAANKGTIAKQLVTYGQLEQSNWLQSANQLL